MDLRPLISIIALLSVFGMPVAIVFVNRYFRFKELELQRGLGGRREEKLLGFARSISSSISASTASPRRPRWPAAGCLRRRRARPRRA